MICWFCYWGWPKPILEIYERAERDIDALLPVAGPENDYTDWAGLPTCGESALKYGPTHCVWADENFGGDFAFELKECESDKYDDWLPGTMQIVRRSIVELAALPDELREPPPEYDGEHPDRFPPTHGVEMARPF